MMTLDPIVKPILSFCWIFLLSLSVSSTGNAVLGKTHLENVKELTDSLNTPKLVMGVNPETESIKRFDDSYFFLNEGEKGNETPRILRADFNSLADLKELAENLSGTFEKIVLDDSCFKFTKWTVNHLKCFKGMLKPGGEFIFGPYALPGSLLRVDFNNWGDLIQVVKENYIDNQNTLVRSYGFPFYYGNPLYKAPSPPNAQQYEPQIQQEFEFYKSLRGLDEEAASMRRREIELGYMPAEEILNDDEKLEETVRQAIYEDVFKKVFMENVVIPENYQPIMEEAFGPDHVKIEYNKPLPFESNWFPVQKVLITATRGNE